MDSFLYLIINTLSILIPLSLSFEKRVNYYNKLKNFLPGLLITIFIFILWDIIFTKLGIWGFNERYLIGISIIELPIEEWLFFFCIPYASIFIHYCKEELIHWFVLSKELTKWLTILLILFLLILSLLNFYKLYTFTCFLFTSILLGIVFFRDNKLLRSFIASYLIILIPFFMVNGVLTGSFITDEIVWYNNNHNLGIRLWTIPFEDIFYGFSLLLTPLYLSREIKKNY